LIEKNITDEKNIKQESKINKTIKDVTSYVESFKFNMAIISLMEMTNYLYSKEEINKKVLKRLVNMMSIFTPHVCEEMWSKLSEKDFVSLAKWPSFDESKIDLSLEAEEESVSQLVADVGKILKLAKVDNPKKVTLFVSSSWKYEFFDKLKKALEKTRNIGEVTKESMIKGHEKDIGQLVPKLMKNASKIPKVIVEKKKELKSLEENKEKVEEQFKCDVEIIDADSSDEAKAGQAVPGKPAILVE
jgi:leucyl-tRNA synthetase